MPSPADRADASTKSVGEAPYPRALPAWTAVGILLLLYALAQVDRQIISLMVGQVRHDFGVGDFQIGMLQGFAFALLYSIFGLPLGIAVDRYSRRWIVFCGVMVWALAGSACGLARTFPQLLTARLLVGAGEAALTPAAFSILGDLFPKRRLTFALGVYSAGAAIGAALSYAIGGLVVQRGGAGMVLPILGPVAAWRFAFLVTGLPGILLAFFVFLMPEPVRRSTRQAPTRLAEVMTFMRERWRFFACHFIAFGCVFAMAYAKLAWLAPLLERRFDWPVARIGLVLAVVNLLNGVIGMPLTGWFVDRLMHRGVTDAHFRFYIYGTILTTMLTAIGVLMPTSGGLFLFVILGGVPLAVTAIAGGAIQLATPPHLRGSVSAVYLMITSIFSLTVGPALVGFFSQYAFHSDAALHKAFAATFAVLGPIAVIGFVLGLRPMRDAVARAQ